MATRPGPPQFSSIFSMDTLHLSNEITGRSLDPHSPPFQTFNHPGLKVEIARQNAYHNIIDSHFSEGRGQRFFFIFIILTVTQSLSLFGREAMKPVLGWSFGDGPWGFLIIVGLGPQSKTSKIILNVSKRHGHRVRRGGHRHWFDSTNRRRIFHCSSVRLSACSWDSTCTLLNPSFARALPTCRRMMARWTLLLGSWGPVMPVQLVRLLDSARL